MSLSELPLECLQCILEHLCLDKPALSRLLQVNTYFCTVTLPYLYGKALPLSLITTHRAALVDPKRVQIVQTLLRQRPAQEISKLLDAAYDVFPTKNSWCRRRCSAIGSEHDRLSVQLDLIWFQRRYLLASLWAGRYHRHWQCYPLRLANYALRAKSATGKKVGEKMNDEEGKEEVKNEDEERGSFISASDYGTGLHDEDLDFPLQSNFSMAAEKQRYAALATTLQRELTWTLCFPVLEQIQEIALPLSDLDRYLDVLHRFQSLRIVSFEMDQVFELGLPVSNGQSDQLRMQEKMEPDTERHRQLENMVAFVEQHVRLFPNQLRDAHCPKALTWRPALVCPPDFEDRMKDALPVLICLNSINHDNWDHVARKINRTDLGSVESVHLLREDFLAPILQRDPQFLGRCRALKTLIMKSREAVSFQWAVQEKRTWDRHQMMLQSHKAKSTAAGGSPELPLRPIPVESIMIVTHNVLTIEMDNIAEAFGKTLMSLTVNLLSQRNSYIPPVVSMGADWRLPEIRSLVVSLANTRLSVDQYLLQRGVGPQLKLLRLLDDWIPNDRREELYPILPPAEPLLELQGLTLQGWPALIFDPCTLHQTPNLQTLELMTFQNRPPGFRILSREELQEPIFYIDTTDPLLPSAGGDMTERDQQPPLQRQPRLRWSWDWQLPRLHRLALKGIFAIQFEFRMLAHCPSLQYLQLYIGSPFKDDKRTVTLQEFLNHPNDKDEIKDGMDNPTRMIVAPSMQTLYLHGPWFMEDKLRAVLFKTTFPNLEVLAEFFTGGYSPWEGWIAPLRRDEMPRLKKVIRWIWISEAGGQHKTTVEKCMADHGMALTNMSTPQDGTGLHPSGLVQENREREEEDTAVDYQLNGRSWAFHGEISRSFLRNKGSCATGHQKKFITFHFTFPARVHASILRAT